MAFNTESVVIDGETYVVRELSGWQQDQIGDLFDGGSASRRGSAVVALAVQSAPGVDADALSGMSVAEHVDHVSRALPARVVGVLADALARISGYTDDPDALEKK